MTRLTIVMPDELAERVRAVAGANVSAWFVEVARDALLRQEAAAIAAFEAQEATRSNDGWDEERFAAVQPHPTAERFFAGAWSACYSAALGLVASQMKVKLPPDVSVDIEVDLGQSGAAWLLQARLTVRAPGLEREVVEKLAHGAHEICPYSKATRGNIDVALNVATS